MNRIVSLRKRRGPLAVAAGVLLSVLLACSVTLISNYDEQIDKSATSLQRQMDSFLTSLDSTPQPTYASTKEFYTDYAVDLRSLLVRAQSHPKNTQTEQQIELMMKSLEDLRQMHEAGPIDPEVLKTTRDMFNQSWKAIITLEMAKKRGD
jgi:hypothetical protein